MGFFSRIFSAGPALNRLAKTCDECLKYLMTYHIYHDKKDLYRAAWLCSYGILSSLEKWHWNPLSTKIFVPNHSEMGRVCINQIVMTILGELSTAAKQIGESETITNIINGEDAYREYAYLVSDSLKSKLRP